MRKFRQYAATTLIVAMVGTNMSIPALADVSEDTGGVKRGWYLDGDDWYFRKGNGKLRKDEYWYMEREKTWYGFDEDGRMYENQLVRDPKLDSILEGDSTEGEITPAYYAYPGGKLAQAMQWMLLNDDDEGTLHVHDDSCGVDCDLETSWYNFEKEDTSDGRYKVDAGVTPDYSLGRIIVGKELKVPSAFGVKWFGFDNQGRMLSRQWVRWKNDTIQEILEPGQAPEYTAPEDDEGVWHYYQYQGERMADGFLPIDGYWYRFDADGNWDGWVEEPATATPSNINGQWIKPDMWMVDSVDYVGGDVEALPGETVNLKFKVTLASDSNVASATPRLKKSRHDIWVSDAKRGKAKIIVDDMAATCTVEYTTSEAYIGEEQFSLCIDGREQGKTATVTIVTKAASTRTEASKSVGNILGAVDKDDPNVTASMLKDSLATLYTGGTEEAPNPVIQKEIKKSLLDNRVDLEKLSSQYASEMFIKEAAPKVDDEAKALLPASPVVEVAGGALNAGKGDTVNLKVSRGSAEAEAKVPAGSNKTRIALDLVLQVTAADSEEAEDLTELDIPVVITISIPAGLKAGSVELWHVHDDGDPEKVEFIRSGNRIIFAADRFSDYVFVGDPDDGSGRPWNGGSSDSGSDGGTSSGSQGSGQWILDAIGWWYKNPDGTYPFNTWLQLMYNTRMDWYHFNQEGYINTGWFTDLDGRVYYLNPLSNGYKGALLTGWQQIDGFWYYFNQESDGYKGALLTNTETPDGYWVNEKGQRVE